MKLNRPIVLAAIAVVMVAIGGGGYLLSRSGGDATRTPASVLPSPSSTPPPPTETIVSATMPTVNVFTGELNGYDIDPLRKTHAERTAFDLCPGTGLTTPGPTDLRSLVTSAGPLQVNPDVLPTTATSTHLEGWVCGEKLAQVVWLFSLAAGTPNVNPGGGSLFVHRIRGREAVIHAAPRERWSAATIGGLEVVLAAPASEELPTDGCYGAAYDPRTDVSTTVVGVAANSAFCREVLNALTERR